ncbi:MAG: RNB domain-containing ribonuclease, partial [Alphaproteobacteria bacterium]|nr:RNB domain-containing ribonuclease [Alphaproteobacteria bacterium]
MKRKPPRKSPPSADKGKKRPHRFKEHFGRRFAKPSEKKVEAKPAREVPSRVVGVVVKKSFGWGLQPTDRREKTEFIIRNPSLAEQKAGELVAAEVLPSSKQGRREAQITHQLGDPDDPRNVSLIAIHTHEIPDRFNEAALREAEAAQPVTLENRADLRDIPLVTIDGPDARDFDDAVFAEAEKDGGWHLIVAIADVAHYVRRGGALDGEAYQRGNSTYFPDRVVPMLPEALSNELCS